MAPAEQDDGATAHAATRRSGVPAASTPPLFISGNHIQRPQRLRKLSEDQQRLRRKVWHSPTHVFCLLCLSQGHCSTGSCRPLEPAQTKFCWAEKLLDCFDMT